MLSHKVRVFVFRYDNGQLSYLLLRRRPSSENILGPIKGLVGIDEHLRDAVLREVREDTGLTHPTHLIDLDHASTFTIGDEGLVEWEFGYQAPILGPAGQIQPGPDVAESMWVGFEGAFCSLEMPEDRDALVRLQVLITG